MKYFNYQTKCCTETCASVSQLNMEACDNKGRRYPAQSSLIQHLFLVDKSLINVTEIADVDVVQSGIWPQALDNLTP